VRCWARQLFQVCWKLVARWDCGANRSKGVVGTPVEVQSDRDAVGAQACGVVEVLVAEDVEFTDADEGRGQAGEVGRLGGGAGGRDVLGDGAVAEDRLPGKEVGRAVPDADVGDLVARVSRDAVVFCKFDLM
jgi:hypothetical protein